MGRWFDATQVWGFVERAPFSDRSVLMAAGVARELATLEVARLIFGLLARSPV